MGKAPQPGEVRPRRDPVLWVVLAIALGLRALLLGLYPNLMSRADENLHLVMGGLVSRFGPAAINHWPPGYEFFLAGIFRAAGIQPLAAKAGQVLVSTVTVGLVYGLARRAAGLRAARIAGLLCALYPSLVAYSQYLYSETLFIALLTAGVYFLHRRAGMPRLSEQIAAGTFFGLAILTRSVPLYFFPVWIGWAALQRRWPEVRSAALVLAVALVVVAPWTARNWLRFERFQLVDATLAETMRFAFGPSVFTRDLGYDWRVRGLPPACPYQRLAGARDLPPVAELAQLFPPQAVSFVRGGREDLLYWIDQVRTGALTDWPASRRCALDRAVEFARAHPEVLGANLLRRIYGFWGPNSFLLREIHLGDYHHGPLRREAYPVVKLVFVSLYVSLVCAAILALGRRGAPRIVSWTALFVGFYTAIHGLAVAFSRYRLPLMPLLIVLAALWLADPVLPQGRARRLAVGTLVLAFLATSAHYAITVLP